MRLEKFKYLIISFLLYGFVTQAYSVIVFISDMFDNLFFPFFRPDENYYAADAIACFIGMLFFLMMFLLINRKDKEPRYFSLSNGKKDFVLMTFLSTVITLGMGGVANLWMDFAYTRLEDVSLISNSLESFGETWSDIDTSPYHFVFLSVVLLGPIVEELMFRGIIQKQLRKKIPFPFPLLFSALAFGYWHQEPVQVVYTAIMGLMIGIVYEYTGNLFFPLYMHVLNNFLSTLPGPLQSDAVYTAIYTFNSILVIPSIYLCLYMGIQIHRRYSFEKMNAANP